MTTSNPFSRMRARIDREGVQTMPRWAARWVYWNVGLYKTPVRHLSPRMRAAQAERARQRVLSAQDTAYRHAQQLVSTGNALPADQTVQQILDLMSLQEPLSFDQQPWDQAALRQRDRLALIAEWTVQHHEGAIVEIGAFLGLTTARLAAVAQKYGRRMIVVDPWETGTQNCDGTEYDTFLENTRAYRDSIDVIRASSLEEQTIAQLRQLPLAFSYVDGLHTHDACLSDIRSVRHTHGIIAVDDIRWHPGTKQAYLEGAAELERRALFHAANREGYLLPRA